MNTQGLSNIIVKHFFLRTMASKNVQGASCTIHMRGGNVTIKQQESVLETITNAQMSMRKQTEDQHILKGAKGENARLVRVTSGKSSSVGPRNSPTWGQFSPDGSFRRTNEKDQEENAGKCRCGAAPIRILGSPPTAGKSSETKKVRLVQVKDWPC